MAKTRQVWDLFQGLSKNGLGTKPVKYIVSDKKNERKRNEKKRKGKKERKKERKKELPYRARRSHLNI